MINKALVEKYLRANGVEPEAPDDEIKEVLFSAKWHEEDVHTALMVLREDPETHETHVDSLHKVFHSDDRLQPETISALLGIDVSFTPPEERQKYKTRTFGSAVVMLCAAAVLSSCVILSAMWFLGMGLFHSV